MTDVLGAGLLGLVLCGLGGLLVPSLIGRIPEPDQPDADKETYAAIAARPGVRGWAVGLSAVAGGLIGLSVGWDRVLVGLLPLVPVGVALAVVDLRTRLLPRLVVLPATGAVLLLGLVGWAAGGDSDDLVRALLGMVGARSFYWLLWRLHSAGMGFGDVRLAALLGFVLAHLGWAELVVGLYSAFVLFAVPGVLLALVRWDRGLLRTAYPFGPAMLAGALLGVCAGPEILAGLVTG